MNTAFSFTSKALPEDTFHVLDFEGTEGLSKLYRFVITLASSKPDIDTRAVVQSPATFTFEREAGKLPMHGILESFEQLNQSHKHSFYRAVLTPKLWWLTLTHHNQIFLDKSCPQILEAVLQDGGLNKGMDFELRLQENYPTWEYACQYDESHFSFASRWMERYGLYYFFEQEEQREKLIITDSKSTHKPLEHAKNLRYAPQSGLEMPYLNEIVTNFREQRHILPATVLLKDYDYLKPGLELRAQAEVSARGQGEIYIYGEHFRTLEEGHTLAAVRAQELSCREVIYEAATTAPFVRCGYTFTLERYFQDKDNQEYLVTGMSHAGSQRAYLEQGMATEEGGENLFYRNTLTAIPASVQFRPQRSMKKPFIHGVMNAVIDGAGSDQYAELDEHGRYKVILPFDLSGRDQGHASSWLRMMQPYVGSDHGMHFPLHKGTEVLLSFIDGDPDRPFIAASVPNPAHKSQVTKATQTKALLTTSGQNLLHMEDKKGSERILMRTPTEDTFLRLGEPNDPASPTWEKDEEECGFKLQTNTAFEVFAGTENEVIFGESSSSSLGGNEKLVALLSTDISALEYFKWTDPFNTRWSPFMDYLHGNVQKAVGADEQLSESQMEIAGQIIKMQAMEQKLNAQKTKLTASKQTIAESTMMLNQECSVISGEKQSLVQENTNLAEENSSISETTTILKNLKTELGQTKTKLSQTKTEMLETKNALFQSKNQILQNKTVLAATIDHMAEDFNTLTDLSLKV